jgi:septum site-determining protein MinD
MVPADDRLIAASNQGIPVIHDKRAPSGAAFSRIAARVDGENIPLMDLDAKSSLMDKVKDIMGINRSAYTHA